MIGNEAAFTGRKCNYWSSMDSSYLSRILGQEGLKLKDSERYPPQQVESTAKIVTFPQYFNIDKPGSEMVAWNFHSAA